MTDDDYTKFKALQSEFESMSAYLIEQDKEVQVGQLRVFKDQGGAIRLHFESSPDRRTKVQLLVGQADLLKRAADPQPVDPS